MKTITKKELIKCVEEAFGDVDEFWNGLHPSVQRLVLKAIKDDYLFSRKKQVEIAKKRLKEAGLTKQEVEFKPRTYYVGGFEIKVIDEDDNRNELVPNTNN
jgi:hypothetical protein